MHFEWKPEYEFNIKEIDDQHQYFFGLLDALYESVLSGSTREELGGLLQSLIDYAANHFATEEKYFAKFDYEGAASHRAEHQGLTAKILNFQKKFMEDKADISVELIDFLEDWLVDHLSNSDRKYVDCFHQHGLY